MSICAACGLDVAIERHHATGTTPAATGRRRYLDPALVVPLCRRDHVAVHAAWERLGLACRPDPLNAFEVNALRLYRLGSTLGRLSRVDDIYPALAAAVVCWAGDQVDAITALDVRLPAWRQVICPYSQEGNP